MGLERVRDGLATHAMAFRWFCDEYCRKKDLDMFKFLRTVRDSCEDFVNPCERFTTVSRLVGEFNRKTVASQ